MDLVAEPRFATVKWPVPSFWRRLRLDAEFDPGDLLLVTRTGELVLVRRAGERFTDVQRGLGSIPCALRANDEVFYVGRAVERVAA
jgi:hypothetical protein